MLKQLIKRSVQSYSNEIVQRVGLPLSVWQHMGYSWSFRSILLSSQLWVMVDKIIVDKNASRLCLAQTSNGIFATDFGLMDTQDMFQPLVLQS